MPRQARSFNRILDLRPSLKRRSVLLLGPRQTGKTTYLSDNFPEARQITLLDGPIYRALSSRPETLVEMLREGGMNGVVVIDEVQKLPGLLDTVQLLIDSNPDLRFVLTGSSARKLKRGQANLLGGRALPASMFPVVYTEHTPEWLKKRITLGGLPGILTSDDPEVDLQGYVDLYLREEIQAEGLVRKLDGFTRFLEVAAICNARQINYQELSNDCGVPVRTVADHFQLLEDTLLGFRLEPFRYGNKRKPVSHAKFYFFDYGIARAIARRPAPAIRTPEYGDAVEHLVINEVRAYVSYRNKRAKLTFWRTVDKLEVDLVIDSDIAIEIKAKQHVSDKDLRGLREIKAEGAFKERVAVTLEPAARMTADGIRILPLEEFLKRLWAGELI